MLASAAGDVRRVSPVGTLLDLLRCVVQLVVIVVCGGDGGLDGAGAAAASSVIAVAL